MLALRILSGPQAGQVYVLKQGRNRLGRAVGCDLQINVSGISKEHLEIQVVGDTASLQDLQSSNGTFLNGVRIKNSSLKVGDRISLDKVLVDLIMHQRQVAVVNSQPPAFMPAPATSQPELTSAPPPEYQPQAKKVDRYVTEVIMPGLYRMVEVFEFRTLILGFAVVFIFSVTLLSIFPLNQITSESIKIESRRRAVTVARALANANERAVRSGEMTGYNADLVLKDDGISSVFILSKDGSIMAPPELAGMVPKAEIAGFAAKIKGQTQEMSAEIGNGKYAASCPIVVFDAELQQNVAKAQAVVVYDTESLKFDDGRAISLFVQMLAIAMVVGGILFFLMYQLIEYPFRRLQLEIDGALREGRDHVEINIQFPILQTVLVAVNSLLARIQQGAGGGSSAQGPQMRDQEWMNLVQMIGFPAILISKDLTVISLNQPFESLTGANSSSLVGQALQFLPDQAMQKNIQELVNLANQNTAQVQFDKLDISGQMFDLQCQAVTLGGDAKYYLVTISIQSPAEGGAA